MGWKQVSAVPTQTIAKPTLVGTIATCHCGATGK
jgi:hypothetical protein